VSDVLSQSEIDALLSAISSGAVDAEQMHEESAERHVRPFDFMRPSKFSKDQLRTLELLHENFCRQAQTNLSAMLRCVVEIDVVSADQVTYGEFVNSMPAPTLINIVTMEPLEGNVVLEVNLPLAFSMIDRLVGGPGTHRPKLRELTEIEHALMGAATETFLSALSEAWSGVFPVSFRISGSETNPQFAQVVAPSEIVVLISFEMRVGTASGLISLCIPFLVLEPAVGHLTAQSYFSGGTEGAGQEARESIERELGGVNVPVSVQLGDAQLSVEDLISLGPGDVIPLGVPPTAEVAVRVGERKAFLGQPGRRGKRTAIQITRQVADLDQGVFV